MTDRLFQPSLAGGEVSPALYARTDISKYQIALRRCRNFVVHRTGGVSNRAGFEFLGEVADHDVCPALIPFRFNNTSQVCLLEFGDLTMRPWYQGALVLDGGDPVSITTSYTAAEAAEMGHAQSGDVMYVAHRTHGPAKLKRMSWTSWSFGVLTFTPAQAAPTGLTATLSGSTHTYTKSQSYKVTFVSDASGEESLASAAVSVTGPTADDWPVGTKVVVGWGAGTDVSFARIYKSDNGIYGWIGNATGTTFEDTNITPDVSDTAPEAQNPFASAGDYPALATFHQQRLCFANTENAPNAVWMSRSGFYENMSKSTPTKADDAISFTLGSGEINEIKGLLSIQDLLIFTSGSENVCNGGSTGKAITAASDGILVKPQTYWGSGDLRPLVSGNVGLFAQGLGAAVRDIGYEYSVDGFTGTDRSVLSRHFLDGHSIVDWAYAQVPDSTFWMVRDDGALLSLTYFKEQDIGAWALHTTDGAFERVAVIEGDDRHEVYAIVRRSIGGATKRYVERMASRRISVISDACLLDSFLVYDGAPTAEISGLDHLEGKTVGILAEGNWLADQVVADGKVSLPRAYGHVVVGLRYDEDSYVETLDLDLGMVQGLGTVQGRKMRVAKVVARIEKSREFLAGPDLDHLTLTKIRLGTYGATPELVTGDVDVTIPPSWSTGGRVVIRPNGPVPLTILALMPELTVGG